MMAAYIAQMTPFRTHYFVKCNLSRFFTRMFISVLVQKNISRFNVLIQCFDRLFLPCLRDVTFKFLCVSCWLKINIQQMFVYQEVQSVWNVELIFYD